MLPRTARTFPLAFGIVVAGGATSQQGGQLPPSCCDTAGEPCCIGQWAGPFDMGISCTSVLSAGRDCGAGNCGNMQGEVKDEIAHAALIPAGTWNDGENDVPIWGKVLVWTRCDRDDTRADGYRAFIWDPNAPDDVDFDLASEPVPAMQTEPTEPTLADSNDGPFCSGHTWMLDELEKPKLFVIGGNDRGDHPFPGLQGVGLHTAAWFDPTNQAQAWTPMPRLSGTSGNFEGVWYPTVLIFYDGIGGFFLLVLGGTGALPGQTLPGGCASHPSHPGLRWTYEKSWTLVPTGAETFETASWATHSGTPGKIWQMYPRALQLSTGDVITVGGTTICEKPLHDYESIDYTPWTQPTEYGPNPVQLVSVTSSPPTRSDGLDPNVAANVQGITTDQTVGGMHYNNVVLLQTLDRKDRILSIGGTFEFVQGDFDPNNSANFTPSVYETDAQPHVLELDLVAGKWFAKSSPTDSRVFANAVVLPDRTILLMGGQVNGLPGTMVGNPYYTTPERFQPGDTPSDPGVWEDMATRPDGAGGITPRGYHSLALLLQDGRVALMGGEADYRDPPGYSDSSDTVEIYSPPYTFESGRLKITGLESGVMRYGEDEFCLNVNQTAQVSHAVLIGISSITHHFDYGARYVELETSVSSCSGYNLKIVPPTNPAEVPEGFYLLFVVEDRFGVRVPCVKARFVKVTF